VKRAFRSFLGIDLGGGRGKTTAVAELRAVPAGVAVFEVAVRSGQRPWTDDTLYERLSEKIDDRVIAVNAPLTTPACGRCTRPVCAGVEACEEPAVVWLRTVGRALVQGGAIAERAGARVSLPVVHGSAVQARLAPYAHRVTDVTLTYQRGLLPPSSLGASTGAVAARAGHLRKRLAGAGYAHHENLIEVSPAATVAALFGVKDARGYKRDADPWRTRAIILERLADLSFAPQSRMAREEVLRNDHCFDAVLAAYTAWLWARDGWEAPSAEMAEDGWVYAP
jgi:hypothetical protein